MKKTAKELAAEIGATVEGAPIWNWPQSPPRNAPAPAI